MTTDIFAPHQALAGALLPHAVPGASDGSHDLSHILRVWANVRVIAASEGGNLEILTAATLLHDCVALEKNDPARAAASTLAADAARCVLTDFGWDATLAEAACHAIAAHSYSAGIPPETNEAKILQDADRLDAIGLIGVARCFYVAGRMGSALYDPHDPLAASRPLDDARYAIDHFAAKLEKLSSGFQTKAGQSMAHARHQELTAFKAAFLEQIG